MSLCYRTKHIDGKDHEESCVAVLRVCGHEVNVSTGASLKRLSKAPLAVLKLYVNGYPHRYAITALVTLDNYRLSTPQGSQLGEPCEGGTLLVSMVGVAQLVRAPGCGPGGRGFETPRPPHSLAGTEKSVPAE